MSESFINNLGNLPTKPSSENINVATKVATATAMALSTSFCLERKFLDGISRSSDALSSDKKFVINAAEEGKIDLNNTFWFKITQIGRPSGEILSSCFAALQNILRSCALPQTRLLFLIVGENSKYNIYFGLYSDANVMAETAIREVEAFCRMSWPGIKTEKVEDNDVGVNAFCSNKRKYSNVFAFTGIPSMDLKETNYPSTIEYLLGGNPGGASMAYLVVADPVDSQNVSDVLYQLDEFRGQAESFKSINLSVSQQSGKSWTHGISITDTMAINITHSESKKNTSGAMAAIGVGIGVAALTLAFPPAGALAAAATASVGAGAAAATSAALLGSTAMGAVNTLVPQETDGVSINNSSSKGENINYGENKSYTETIGQNYVNGHIESIEKELSLQTDRFLKGKGQGMWNVGCYLFTGSSIASSQIQLKSLLSGQNSKLEPIRIHDLSKLLSQSNSSFICPPRYEVGLLGKNGTSFNSFPHPFGTDFSTLTTCLTTEELTSMINFPLHSVPGVSVIDCPPEFCLNELPINGGKHINLGNLLNRGFDSNLKCILPANSLAGHCLVTGVNGSGKTNTVLSILNNFLKENLPFLILEPAKTEYVDWALKYNEGKSEKDKILVFMPGCDKYRIKEKNGSVSIMRPARLHLNPFEIIGNNDEFNISAHIDRLKSIFASAFPMQEILPVVTEHLLFKLYGLEDIEEFTGHASFPILSDINQLRIREVMNDLQYGQENTLNISAALRTRFKSLTYGWKGELLNNQKLGLTVFDSEGKMTQVDFSWSDFFGKPVVLNLSCVGDDQDKAFIMSIVLEFLYEYRIWEHENGEFSFNDNDCRHISVIEEAHRVMTRCENPEMPQYKSAVMFKNFLSELRAYGQGTMIVDQIPSRLIEDAIKNTNIKIIHRLVAHDDAQTIGDCVGLNEQQKEFIPKLGIGQAIVAGISSSDINGSNIFLTQVTKIK